MIASNLLRRPGSIIIQKSLNLLCKASMKETALTIILFIYNKNKSKLLSNQQVEAFQYFYSEFVAKV
jgi:hypothetical protein